jgi:Restriction endonuclease S subunits
VSASRQLPEGWAWATLDEFTQGRGQSLDPSRHKAETFELYSIPGFDAGAPELLNGSAIGSAKQMVNAGDVLLSKINPRINRVWLVGEDRGFRQIASTEWIVFPRNDYINGDYLKFFLRQHHVRNFLASNVSGVGGSLMRIKASTLDGYPIPVAPRDEQRRIVEKIEALFAELDKGEESLRQVQKLLARYRQSVLKAAVTGELTADWRARHAGNLEHGRDLLARILKARRENWQGRGKYKEPVEPDTTNLPELPEGWVWASIDQLFQVFGGATPSRRDPANWGGNIPWVSSGEVAFCRIRDTKEKITEKGYRSCSTRVHPKGTVLLAMIGEGKTRGQAAILDIPACNNQNSAAIRVSETEIPPEYVYYYLMGRYETSRREGQGGNQPALSGERVKSFAMPLSSIDEMREIVSRLRSSLDMASEIEAVCESELSRAAVVRQAVLKYAFSGKLVPQDLNDEPASELLARIRAQRASESRKTTRRAATA